MLIEVRPVEFGQSVGLEIFRSPTLSSSNLMTINLITIKRSLFEIAIRIVCICFLCNVLPSRPLNLDGRKTGVHGEVLDNKVAMDMPFFDSSDNLLLLKLERNLSGDMTAESKFIPNLKTPSFCGVCHSSKFC